MKAKKYSGVLGNDLRDGCYICFERQHGCRASQAICSWMCQIARRTDTGGAKIKYLSKYKSLRYGSV